MNPTACFLRLRWLQLPAALLIVLLQRTPVLRLLVAAEERLVSSPVGAVLRSAAAALGSLGALHSLAGATTMRIQQGTTVFVQFGDPPRLNSPIPLTAGNAISPILIFVSGAPVQPGSYEVTNLPPGLSAAGANASGLVNASSVIINGTPTTTGTFNASVLAWEFRGGSAAQSIRNRFPDSGPLTVAFTVSGSASTMPTITTQPAGQVVSPGGSASFSVAASGSPAPTYQWQRNGTSIAGATNATLALANVQAADAGDYRVIVTNSAGSVPSDPATLSVVGAGSSARLSNLSVRTAMAAGQTLIVGFVVEGGTRDVLVRAAGPALAAFGLGDAMADPRVESATAVLNDDWNIALGPTFARVAAFAFAAGSKDAALVQSLNGGASYLIRGTGPGTVLVEAYDVDESSVGRLINVSARNHVGAGDAILIAGLNIAGSGVRPLLIRAVGPKLGAFGVTGFLADPRLEVFRGTTNVGVNDDWDSSLAATFVRVGAFALDPGSRDAALLTSLEPGSYTVQVRGANNATGEALVEIYEVP